MSAPRFANDRPAHVLIVDDERHNRQLLEVMLAPEGVRVTSAVSGEEALVLVADDPPDLVLLDVMMPGLDGYQVASQIKSNPATQNVIVIMVTALGDHDARMNGLRAGAEDVLTKPVDRAELSARIKNLLRLKAYADHHDEYSQRLERQVISRTVELVDRTERLEAQATALRRCDERTTYALGAARMCIWELDIATGQYTWSETMAPLFGLDPDAVPATLDGYLALIHPDDRPLVAESIAQTTTRGTDYEVEYRVQIADGSLRWLSGRGRMVRDDQGQPLRLLGVSADISDQKSLQAQLRQSQKMEAVGQLAGGIAHDFNNLLTAILGYSSFVIATLDAGDVRRADMEEVIAAGQRAAGLTRQLLAFSRKQVLQPTVVDINLLVTEMRDMLSRLIGERVQLVSILADVLAPVRADRGQLEQVLMNLVVNARDAMPDGGRLSIETANVELDRTFKRDVVIQPGSYVMLAVSDDGIGMDAATKSRLFEPFFTTKEVGKGTGLGLATVYGIVKQSGGYVWVFSDPGQGSSFKVYLPRAVGSSADVEAGPADKPVVSAGEAILVVEDDEAVRTLTSALLSRSGYRVHSAAEPRQAEVIFDEDPDLFSLLVTDVIMPGEAGPQLYKRLASRRPSLRVLYLSGYTDDAIVQQGELPSGIQLLQKPFTADALNRRVREILDR